MVKEQFLDLPVKHRLFVFNYVNILYSALSNAGVVFSSEGKIEKLNQYLEESLPVKPGTFSNFPVGQAYISSIYSILLEDLHQSDQIKYAYSLADKCPRNQHRLLEQLIRVNPTLLKALEDLASFYNLINPNHYLMISHDRVCLYTKFPYLSYDLPSLFFEISWIIKVLNQHFNLSKKEFSKIELGKRFIYLPLDRSEFKLKSSRPDPNLKKILQRQAYDTLKQLFGFDHTSIKNERIAKEIKYMLDNIYGGHLTIKEMAHHLGLSERTLQRRLLLQNLSFTELIQFMRFEVAKQMLEVPIFKVTEIAQSLGYSESSAFTRAFKKNEGISPLKYRKQFIN